MASGLLSDQAVSEDVAGSTASSGKSGVKIGKATEVEYDSEEEDDEEAKEAKEDVSNVEIDSGIPPEKLASSVVACCIELTQIDFSDIPEISETGEVVKLRIGVHSGSGIGGLIGKKVAMYALVGNAVAGSAQLCATSEPGKIHVSPASCELLQGEFECEEKGGNVAILVSFFCFFFFFKKKIIEMP